MGDRAVVMAMVWLLIIAVVPVLCVVGAEETWPTDNLVGEKGHFHYSFDAWYF